MNLGESFKDGKGKVDAKRLTAFMCAVYVFTVGFSNLFYGKTPADFIFYSIITLLFGLFGLSLPEYLSKNNVTSYTKEVIENKTTNTDEQTKDNA